MISNEFDVMVEVRWFYRKFEIPGAKLATKSKSNDGDGLEEIFETDQVDACPAECLLAPLKLHEVSRPEESSLPSVVSGMPCIHYHCRRYWSIHRKSFVPSGVLSNRIERGRMHSEYKTALSKLQSTSVANGKRSSEGYSWKEAFQSAIQKLSLAEAAADIQVHGMELKCRERERQHIGSFLRKAIRGLEQPLNGSQTQDDDSVFGDDEGLMNTKSSIFICGPPGTGKVSAWLLTLLSSFWLAKIVVICLKQPVLFSPIRRPLFDLLLMSSKTNKQVAIYQSSISSPLTEWRCAVHSIHTSNFGKHSVERGKKGCPQERQLPNWRNTSAMERDMKVARIDRRSRLQY